MALVSLLCILDCSTAEAQVGTATITASSGSGAEGSVVPLTVSLNSSLPAAAFSFGIALDPNSVSVGNIAISPFLQSLRGGLGPEFVTINPLTITAGFNFAVLLTFISPVDATIPANVDHPIATFAATVLPGAPPGVSPIELRSDLAEPGMIAVEVVASPLSGIDMVTTGVNGAFEVLGSGATAILEVVPPLSPAALGGSASTSLSLTGSLPVGGFSFGLAHDPATLALVSGDVVMGSDLAASRGGLGPEFLSIDIFSGGFTFATVINVSSPGTDLAAGITHEIAQATYSVPLTAAVGPTALTFVNTLGSPAVLTSVGMGTVTVEPPTLVNASISIMRPFRRGDVNQNGFVTITDATGLLAHLFLGTTIACRDAADINSSQTLTITDPISLLQYLFDGGNVPAAPFGACGVPAASSTLTCASSNCP